MFEYHSVALHRLQQTLHGDSCFESSETAGSVLAPQQAQSFLDNQQLELATGDAADVTLTVGDDDENVVNLRYTRFLLCAQSIVFRRMLHGSMAEGLGMLRGRGDLLAT